jgi:glucosamine-6-phosphate deaminase
MAEDVAEQIEGPLPVFVAGDRAAAEQAVAAEIAELARGASSTPLVLGLATGRTMRGLYRLLARMAEEGELDPARLRTFNLDEYLGLEPDDPRTFRREMRAALFEPLGLRPEQTGFPPSTAPSAEACEAYERAIEEAGGIDLQLVGIGRDGHVAFNEPGSARDSRTRVVELHELTRRDAAATFGSEAAVPSRAVTMGVATILAARRVRAMAFGAAKAPIVGRLMRSETGPELPATFLREHPDVALWLDPEAAAEVPRS